MRPRHHVWMWRGRREFTPNPPRHEAPTTVIQTRAEARRQRRWLFRPRGPGHRGVVDLRHDHLTLTLLVRELDVVTRLQAGQIRRRVAVSDKREVLPFGVPDGQGIGLLIDGDHIARQMMRQGKLAGFLCGCRRALSGRVRRTFGDGGAAKQQRGQGPGEQNGCPFHRCASLSIWCAHTIERAIWWESGATLIPARGRSSKNPLLRGATRLSIVSISQQLL